MKTKTIKQTISFKAKPEDVYNALMSSKLHSKFTGSKAVISNKVGGKFSAYNKYIIGTNLELVPGKKIVQSWRSSEWEKGHISKVTFIFSKVKSGTKLSFTHADIPLNDYESIKQG